MVLLHLAFMRFCISVGKMCIIIFYGHRYRILHSLYSNYGIIQLNIYITVEMALELRSTFIYELLRILLMY